MEYYKKVGDKILLPSCSELGEVPVEGTIIDLIEEYINSGCDRVHYIVLFKHYIIRVSIEYQSEMDLESDTLLVYQTPIQIEKIIILT